MLYLVRTSCGWSSITVAASPEGGDGRHFSQRGRLLLLRLSDGAHDYSGTWS